MSTQTNQSRDDVLRDVIFFLVTANNETVADFQIEHPAYGSFIGKNMAKEPMFGNDPLEMVTFVAKCMQSSWVTDLDCEFQKGLPFYTRLVTGDLFGPSSTIHWSRQ